MLAASEKRYLSYVFVGAGAVVAGFSGEKGVAVFDGFGRDGESG